MFIIVLGQHVSILVESSSGHSKIQILTWQCLKCIVGSQTLTFLIYLLTPWCRVPLEKLTGLQIVKKFPAFHGTRRFITALTSLRHLSLFWSSPIQSIYPHPTSCRSILILSTHLLLGLPSGLYQEYKRLGSHSAF